MKLLIVTQKVDRNDPVLGFFHEWIRAFAQQCEKVTVICLWAGDFSLPSNVSVLSLGKSEGKSKLIQLFRFYMYMLARMRQYDSVFVHMNQIYILLGGAVWRLFRKKIALWYAHGYVPFSLRIATIFTNIIFTSTKSGFRIPSRKVHIVGQGIDTALFTPSSREKQYDVISVGRISPVKHFEVLIQALSLAAQKGKILSACIVGGAETEEQMLYLKKLRQLAADKGILQQITFTGPLSHGKIVPYLQESAVFVNTSETGSLDKTGLEAMAIGLPILTCNEAYEEILGSQAREYMFKKGDAGDLVQKLLLMTEYSAVERQTRGATMRAIVTAKHSLPSLISTMVSYL